MKAAYDRNAVKTIARQKESPLNEIGVSSSLIECYQLNNYQSEQSADFIKMFNIGSHIGTNDSFFYESQKSKHSQQAKPRQRMMNAALKKEKTDFISVVPEEETDVLSDDSFKATKQTDHHHRSQIKSIRDTALSNFNTFKTLNNSQRVNHKTKLKSLLSIPTNNFRTSYVHVHQRSIPNIGSVDEALDESPDKTMKMNTARTTINRLKIEVLDY